MEVLRLKPAHAEDYRTLMLQAYANEPDAWRATVEERASLPLDWWAARLSEAPDATEMILGALVDSRLVGAAGLRFAVRPTLRHKASLFGLTVLPQFRGQGIARVLVGAVLEQACARQGTRVVQLVVSESNQSARRLYETSGFQSFGIEPLAFSVGDRLLPMVHMWCDLQTLTAPSGDAGKPSEPVLGA